MNKEKHSGNVKCHKCRHILLTDMNSTYITQCTKMCSSHNNRNFIYILDDQLPDWIKKKIEDEQWTKGKLHCENCGSKLGSFDFVSGRKCECGTLVLPPVHLVTSQVDIPIPIHSL